MMFVANGASWTLISTESIQKKKKPFCNAFAFQTTGKKKYKKYGKVKTKCINIKEL